MRPVMFLIALLTLLVVAAPLALASGDAAAKPSLLHVDPWTVVIAIVTFLLLLTVLAKFAWGPLLSGMKAREDKIAASLDEAKQANEQARALIGEYESKLAEAKDEALSIAEEARRDALDIKAQIETEARASAEASVERAKVEIRQLTDTAWEAIVQDAATLSTEAAGKIIGRELSPEGHAQLVHQVVADFAEARARRGASS